MITLAQPELNFDRRVGNGRHAHSRAAFHGEQKAFGQRHQQILGWLKTQAEYHPDRRTAFTDREIVAGLRFPEMNCIRPRVNELLAGGLLRLGESRICQLTRKRVRTVEVAV